MKQICQTLVAPWVVACLVSEQDSDLDQLSMFYPGHHDMVMAFYEKNGNYYLPSFFVACSLVLCYGDRFVESTL